MGYECPVKHGILLIGVLLLTGVAYSGLLTAGFAWDDYSLVRDNALTPDWANFSEFFSVDLWETTRLAPHPSGFYRPLFLVSLAMDHSLGNGAAGFGHAHSILWHLLSVCLIYRLGQQLHSSSTGLIAAGIFALHPVQHEAVALIAARNDSMATSFCVMALLCLLAQSVSRKHLFLGGLALLMALFSKESAILAPLFLLALDWARWGKAGARARYIAMAIAVFVYFIFRTSSSVGSSPWPSAAQWGDGIAQFPKIAGAYAEMLLWPSYLTPARSTDYLDPAATLAPFLALAVLGMAVLIRMGRENRLIWAFLAWGFLCLAPTFLVTLGKGNLGERYLYMPMAGISLAVALALPARRLTGLVLGAFAVLSVLQIVPRNADWKDYASLWSAAYEERPSTYTAGGYAWAKENIEDDPLGARELYMEALRGEPVYRTACEAAVLVNVRLKRFESAVAVAEWAHTERQCAPSPLFTDAYLYAMGGSGEHQKIKQLFGGNRGGPKPSQAAILSYAAFRRDENGARQILSSSPNPQGLLSEAIFFSTEIVRDSPTANWLRASTTPPAAGAAGDRSP